METKAQKISCKTFQAKDLCEEFNHIKDDPKYKKQLNKDLNDQYIKYAQMKGSGSLATYPAMVSRDKGFVVTEKGLFAKFWFKTEKKGKIKHKVLIREEKDKKDQFGINSFIFVKGSKQYVLADRKSKKLYTIGVNTSSKKNWRKKCIYNKEITYHRNGGTHIRYSGIRDVIYVREGDINFKILSTRNRKVLRNLKRLAFRGKGYDTDESVIADYKCIPSRELVVFLHAKGSIKLMDSGLNVIQRVGWINVTDSVRLSLDSFDVIEKVPGDRASPLILFATANDYHHRKKAYLSQISVKSDSDFELKSNFSEYKKRVFYDLEPDQNEEKLIETLRTQLEEYTKQVKRLLVAGHDFRSEDLKTADLKLNATRTEHYKKTFDKKMKKSKYLYERSPEGPFELTLLDILATNPHTGFQNYNLMASIKFAGYLDKEGLKYPVFLGSEWGGDGGLLLYVINEENKIICPHPRFDSLIRGHGVYSCLQGSWDGEECQTARKVFYITVGDLEVRRFEIDDKTRAELLKKIQESDVKDFEGLEHI